MSASNSPEGAKSIKDGIVQAFIDVDTQAEVSEKSEVINETEPPAIKTAISSLALDVKTDLPKARIEESHVKLGLHPLNVSDGPGILIDGKASDTSASIKADPILDGIAKIADDMPQMTLNISGSLTEDAMIEDAKIDANTINANKDGQADQFQDANRLKELSLPMESSAESINANSFANNFSNFSARSFVAQQPTSFGFKPSPFVDAKQKSSFGAQGNQALSIGARPSSSGQKESSVSAFGQPSSFGQPTSFGQSKSALDIAVGQETRFLGNAIFGQSTFGRTSFEQNTSGHTAFGKSTFGQNAFGNPSFGQVPFTNLTYKPTMEASSNNNTSSLQPQK